jgi:hypothetical protein
MRFNSGLHSLFVLLCIYFMESAGKVGLLPRAMLKTGSGDFCVTHSLGVTTTNRDRRASTASGHTGGLLYITTTDRRKMSLVKTSAEHFITISCNISTVLYTFYMGTN